MKKKGHVFIGQFRAIRMESDEQLLHVSRYIHLNPLTGYIVKTIEKTEQFPWSSFHEYMSRKGICEKQTVLGNFASPLAYKQFVEDQKDYQQDLARAKHALIDEE